MLEELKTRLELAGSQSDIETIMYGIVELFDCEPSCNIPFLRPGSVVPVFWTIL